MKFRIQQVADNFWRQRFLFCIQPLPDDQWQCREVRRGQLDRELHRLGFEDYRDTHEIFSKLDAAVRHYGLGTGYVEYDMEPELRGPERFDGDPRLNRS